MDDVPKPVGDVPEAVRDAGYVLVGLGVLWFQRAMVASRELSKDLPDLRQPLADAVRGAAGAVRSMLDGTAPAPPADR